MTNQTAERSIANPEIWPDNKEFWAAMQTGKLLVKHCRACGESHWYPRPLCPFCMSADTDWRESAGTGTIYTFSVNRRVGPVPYVIAYVTLDEGVTMLTNIVDCDFDKIRIGDRVRMVPKPSENGTMVPMFTPAA
ncbi:Zn-ribbon domain-containing OB-fold protein [Acidocella sp.]|uniref:Zn-ribbon domain-containing OB-fold protein n=1 Tax=Acidocella sp. TaxID=50710 RepID=UPI00260BF260|nr:Zn-ribbon domain-containing OB-fold protein [Acidocella sp.]